MKIKKLPVAVTAIALMLLLCMAACARAHQQIPDVSPSEPSTKEETGSTSDADVAPSGQENDTADEQAEVASSETEENSKEISEMKMTVQIGTTAFRATLEDNAAVREFVEMMQEAPVSIEMSDYSGFEKVGPLGRSLTADDQQTTTDAGDIVLYNGSNIVMFYGSNSWSYTRIGHIDDLTGWEDALGSGSITAVFSIVE